MTTAVRPAEVAVHVDGAVSATCAACDLYAELADASADPAGQAFLEAHAGEDEHVPLLPPGWRVPLARWCALSQ